MNLPKVVKAKLTENIKLSENHYVSWLYTPDISSVINPGQFVMVESGQYLLRPFSVYEVRKNEIGIVYKIIGNGTEYLSKLKKENEITIHGPLGNGFTFPEDEKKTILIVAGGIGIATFPLVVRKAFKNGYKIKVLYGARNKNDFVLVDELKKYSEVLLISDDGSSGKKGFVTELLKDELLKNSNQEVLVCGPSLMLNAVIKLCNEFKIKAQISFEEYMACGYGVCMSCVVKVSDKYTRTCVDGPVIRSDLINIM